MKPRLLMLLTILVLAPLASLTWLGLRMAQDERARTTTQFNGVIDARLSEIATTIGRVMSDRGRTLLRATEALPTDHQAIRTLRDAAPEFEQLMVLNAESRLAFPPHAGPNSEAERHFLERTRGLWEGRVFARHATQEAPDQRSHGWHIWYWGGGLNLMFWRRLSDRRLVAIELNRINLLADVVAALPNTAGQSTGRTALLDSAGRVVYQWGAFEPQADTPRRSATLPGPLQAWRLEWAGPAPAGAAAPTSLWAGLGAIALALVGLALWFYRESSRDLRRAEQRVTFVNQVSHELKTPLTNIRMYAELLEDELYDADPRAERYVGIIVSESQRLSRLIGNILTFARQAKNRLVLRPGATEFDDLVRRIIDQHRPALEHAHIPLTLSLDAPACAQIDADVLGQILGNLLSNVEKYAPDAPLQITSQRHGDTLQLHVHDGGPGIQNAQKHKVFEPFYRLSNALTDRATGTGIGLGLARDLARLHGGDLDLTDDPAGAHFVVTLHAPLARPEAP
jgi:signal transduction histidine kinase